MTKEQMGMVRAFLFEMRATVNTASGAGKRLNDALVAGSLEPIAVDAEVRTLVAKLDQAAWEPYKSATAALVKALQITSVPTTPITPDQPAPTQPSTPSEGITVRPPTTMTDEQVLIVRHMNYEARREYQTATRNLPLHERLMNMTLAMHEKRAWTDGDPGTLLGMMTKTAQGSYWENLALIKKYASDVGVAIKDVPPPAAAPSTPPTPVEPNPQQPPPVVDTPPGPSTPAPQQPTGTAACPLVGPTPEAFQWPREENGYRAPLGSGGPAGRPVERNIHHNGFICVANAAPAGTSATSGPNGQPMGIGGRSRGKIRVNTVRGADGDGGSRNCTNYIALEPRIGVGTITRRGWDIYCSVPDAIAVDNALYTKDENGKGDAGVYILERYTATHFRGNWNDPAMDYENRPFEIHGWDQPDRDRFSTKDGVDSNAGYGFGIIPPRNATQPKHKKYADGGYSDNGDFLLRIHHDDGEDIGRYSRLLLYNEGRGVAVATSDGAYGRIQDVVRFQPGANGSPGALEVRGALNQPSDRRLKKNIEALELNEREALAEVRAVEFDWKDRPEAERKDVGFIAQDVERVFPQLVSTDADTGMKAVDYSKMVPVLWEIVSRQADTIDELERRIAAGGL